MSVPVPYATVLCFVYKWLCVCASVRLCRGGQVLLFIYTKVDYQELIAPKAQMEASHDPFK